MRQAEKREHIFKLLFMAGFNSDEEMPEQLALYFEEIGELREKDKDFIEKKYKQIYDLLPQLDALLNEKSHGWKTERMNRVDLNVLRVAAYEILYDPDVPTGVAINEAVEIAKTFGGETSGSFVNGILGKIAKENESDKTTEETSENKED